MGMETKDLLTHTEVSQSSRSGRYSAVAARRQECPPNMALSVRSRLWAGLAAGVLTVATSAAATAGAAQAATTPGPNTPQKVPPGILAGALPGASVFGDTPAATPEQVSFIMKERNLSQLESSVTKG